jgi:hypothetical protein
MAPVLWLVLAGGALLWLSLALFLLALRPFEPRRRGRARRRGGYIRLSLPASSYERAPTGEVRLISTGCKLDGPLPAAADGLALRARLSSSGARGSFTDAMASSRGGRMTAADGPDVWAHRRHDPRRIIDGAA